MNRFKGMLMLCWALCTPMAGAQGEPPTPEQVQAAIEQVRTDPNLVSEKTERVLRWKKDTTKKPPPDSEQSAWVKWIKDFVAWLNQAGRVLMWVLGAVAAVLALWAVRRWFVLQGEGLRRVTIAAPTHVQDLDIRPDSLPDDIGAATWLAWQRATDWGARRAALSLLYRGALSRLVHGFAMPIRASSTEGECVALAQAAFAHQRLERSAARTEFVAQLIQVWQRAVYGLQAPADAVVHSLCQDFAAHLTPAEPTNVA